MVSGRFFLLFALLGSVGPISAVGADEPSTEEKQAVEANTDDVVEARLFGRITDELGEPVTDARLTLRGKRVLDSRERTIKDVTLSWILKSLGDIDCRLSRKAGWDSLTMASK